ncbi:hypothetical protein ABVT39_022378 [Epinephelus coioides]
MTAEAISAKILEVLEPLQLDPGLCIGFGFDGASVISGNRGGLFEVSNYATKGLRSSTLSVTDCIDLIEGLKDSYTKFRNENDAFEKVMALTDELMNKHEIVCWDITGSRKRKLPARLSNTHVDSTLGKSAPIQQNSDLQKLWNDILDKQMVELNTRFKPDTYGFMRATAACLPRSDTFGDKALIQPACAHFSFPVQDAEHTVFVQQLKRKCTNEKKETLSVG